MTLCGGLQLEELSKRGEIEYRAARVADVRSEQLNWSNMVFLVRGDSPLEAWIAKRCRETGRAVIYVLDDDLLNVPPELGSGVFYNSEPVQRSIRALLGNADCIASPSELLLRKYGEGSSTIQIIEPASRIIKEKQRRDGNVIFIGFAGSTDRGGDIDTLLSDALERIKELYGSRIQFEFFGPETGTAEKLGARVYPYVDSYEAYQERMEELNWDIGLAPMPRSEFHRYKHYNKLVEYSGFGIAGVYSREEPYIEGVEDGINGILCENTTKAWVEAISRLIEDDELRRSISQECLRQARECFSVEKSAVSLDNGLKQIQWSEDPEPIRGLRAERQLQTFSYLINKIKESGVKAPVVVLKKLLAGKGSTNELNVRRTSAKVFWLYVIAALLFYWAGGDELRGPERWFGRNYWLIAGGLAALFVCMSIYLDLAARHGRSPLPLRVLDGFRRYRFLIRQLVSRDFKTKYKRSVLGVLWSFLNPLLTMAVQYVVFSTLFKSDIPNFPLYLLTGIVCFNFFNEATNMSMLSIVGNASLITKVYVPKYIYPITRVLSSAINFVVSLIPLLLVMLFTRTPIRLSFILLPYPVLCLIALCIGMGFLLSTLMVFFRDTQFLWGVLVVLWMYATPIFYPESILPEKYMVLFKCNPLYHIIRMFRIMLIQGVSPEPKAYALCFVASFVPLIIGAIVFKMNQDKFVVNL